MGHRGLTNTISKAAIVAAALTLFAAPAVTIAQQAPQDLTTMPPVPHTYAPKHTAWGDPDLRGTWPLDKVASIPFQRPAQYGNRFWLTEDEYKARVEQANGSEKRYEAEDKSGKIGMGHWVESDAAGRRTAMLIDPANGQLPAFTPQAQALIKAGRTSWTPNTPYNWVTDFDSWDRCISRGFPASMFPFRYNNGIRVFQSPGFVSIQLEMLGTRIIPLRTHDHWPAAVESWLGNSIGHWEGNTLVIETTNLKTGDSATTNSYARNGSPLNMATMGVPPNNVIPTSKQAKVIERITPTSADSMVYEMTYSDPEVFSAPFTAREDWIRNDKYAFYEYACFEGDVQVRNYINASRAGRLSVPTAAERLADQGGSRQ